MLKTILPLVFAVGVFCAPQNGQTNNQAALMTEFKDFIAVMPMQRMYTTLLNHLNTDLEMQAALKHMQSKEFQLAIRALLNKPSVKEIMMKFRDAGFDIDRYEKMVNNIIAGLTIAVPEGTEKSFGKFLDDIDKMMPYDKLMGILAKKLEDSPVFIQFFNFITSDDMHTLSDKTMHSVEFKHLAKEVEDMDIPLYKAYDAMYSIFGWKNKQTSANDL